MPAPRQPSDFEQQVLLAVWHLGDNAYGVTVQDELTGRTGKRVAVGAIYVTLVRLEKKGWLGSALADPTPVRGGKSKRFFTITDPGIDAVRQARRTMDRLWEGLPAAAKSRR